MLASPISTFLLDDLLGLARDRFRAPAETQFGFSLLRRPHPDLVVCLGRLRSVRVPLFPDGVTGESPLPIDAAYDWLIACPVGPLLEAALHSGAYNIGLFDIDSAPLVAGLCPEVQALVADGVARGARDRATEPDWLVALEAAQHAEAA